MARGEVAIAKPRRVASLGIDLNQPPARVVDVLDPFTDGLHSATK